jgi:hypothetical protein
MPLSRRPLLDCAAKLGKIERLFQKGTGQSLPFDKLGTLQGGDLDIEILICGGDAGVADGCHSVSFLDQWMSGKL